MSDQWECYPKQNEGKQSLVLVDCGINKEIANIEIDTVLVITVQLKSRLSEGLARDAPNILSSIEEFIEKYINSKNGYYVGRITQEKERVFYGYVTVSDSELEEINRQIAIHYKYEAVCSVHHDPERSFYWKYLYPSDEDWQIISDFRVIEQLQSHGDNLEKEREIFHCVLFESKEALENFIKWAKSHGFILGSIIEPNEANDFSVEISHLGRPNIHEISQFTLSLSKKVKEFNGTYDGWGTTVEKQETGWNRIKNMFLKKWITFDFIF